MYRRLRVAIRWCVDHCVWVVGATVAAFVMALVGFGHIPQQFFPTSERTELFVQLRMPEGSAIGATLAAAKKAEQLIAGDDDAATWTTYVGSGPPRFWLGLNPALPNEAYAEIVIVARDIKTRERLKKKIDTAVRMAPSPRRACEPTASISGRRSVSRSSSASSAPTRTKFALLPIRFATSCAPTPM
jgi:multidrug efflux pump subunit AcrB